MKNVIQFVGCFLIIIMFYSCKERETPLDKALEEIENSWSKEKLNEFSKKDRETALSDIHFSYGISYRNEHFWNPKDSTLLKYFQNLNVKHIDHMSGIVFSSLHRKLNNEPINLEETLETIYKIQDREEKLLRKNENRALLYYKKYKVGDTISVRMPINRNNSASQYMHPEDSNWIYNDSLDLVITGIIKEKLTIEDTLPSSFKIEVLKKNKPDVKILSKTVGIGDTFDIGLMLNIIEDFRGNSID